MYLGLILAIQVQVILRESQTSCYFADGDEFRCLGDLDVARYRIHSFDWHWSLLVVFVMSVSRAKMRPMGRMGETDLRPLPLTSPRLLLALHYNYVAYL